MRYSLIVAAALVSCSPGLPPECEPDTTICDDSDLDNAADYCDGAVTFVRPDVCTSYPFGAEYAGAFYCGPHMVEAWCAP